MERYLRTDRCCFCMDLRTGSIVWGILGVFFGISGILGYLSGSEALAEQYTKNGVPPETSLVPSGMYHFNDEK